MNSHSDRTTAVSFGAPVQYDIVKTLFNATRVEQQLRHVCQERFAAVADVVARIEQLGHCVTHSERDYDGEMYVLIEMAPYVYAYLNVEAGEDGNAYLTVAARTHADAKAQVDLLTQGIRREDTDDGRVALRLWSKAGRAPSFTRRVMDAPALDEVQHNYPTAPRAQFADVCTTEQDAVGGLALWYGPPGTGKTTAVRALARAWRSWCDVHVVVDPEVVLADPGYLMKVITERSFEEDLPAGALKSDKRSRLIVLEDAGELLAADARTVAGQGLSRILNVTDGLIGRGLNTSILITTNEEIGTLHPAIRRPGRCWSQIRFGRFSGPEAREWLEARELDASGVTGSRSLAELYAMERGETIEVSERATVGFLA